MFTTDQRTVSYLTVQGVQHVYRDDITYAELELGWNKHNHGRPPNQGHQEEAVGTYAARMMAGSPAPAVVLYENADGVLEVLDGVQRLNANEKLGKTTFCGYVVDTTVERALKLRICFNNVMAGSAPVDKDFAIAQMVLEFIIGGNETAQDVATFVGRTVADVEKHTKRERSRMLVKGLTSTTQNPEGVVFREGVLDSIGQGTEKFSATELDTCKGVMKNFFVDLGKCSFKNGDANQHVIKFFDIKMTGNKKRDVQLKSKLATFKKDPIVKSRLLGRRVSTVDQRLTKHLRTLLNQVKALAKDGHTFSAEELVKAWDQEYSEAGRYMRQMCTTKIRQDLDPFKV